MCSGKALLGGANTSPLAGKVPRCLEPKTGSAPEALQPLPVPEPVSFCSPHSHLCRPVSEQSRNQDGSPRCSGKALPGRADTSPLAGKVPGCLDPKTGSASKAVSFCSPHCHMHRLVSEGSGNQDGSPRCPKYTLNSSCESHLSNFDSLPLSKEHYKI
jgi:hypothetical protein